MNMDTELILHHCCQNVTRGNLDLMVEMYALLGFKIAYTPPTKDWVLMEQPDISFKIQVTQTDEDPIRDLEKKRQTHLGFISNDPSKVLGLVKEWAADKQLDFREGEWSQRERYFDLPDVFVNFVIEVMHSSVIEE